jgi:hypothetical protein
VAIEATRRQLLVSSLALSFAACRTATPDLTGFTEEEPPRLSSSITASEPGAAAQLVSGWNQIEDNAWRWTAPRFSAVLRPPPGSSSRGATLQFHFYLPEGEMSRLKAVTISAAVQGSRLTPETYRAVGEAVYVRDVPASVLSGDSVPVEFALDKRFVPGNGDPRILGVIAKRLSLETK